MNLLGTWSSCVWGTSSSWQTEIPRYLWRYASSRTMKQIRCSQKSLNKNNWQQALVLIRYIIKQCCQRPHSLWFLINFQNKHVPKTTMWLWGNWSSNKIMPSKMHICWDCKIRTRQTLPAIRANTTLPISFCIVLERKSKTKIIFQCCLPALGRKSSERNNFHQTLKTQGTKEIQCMNFPAIIKKTGHNLIILENQLLLISINSTPKTSHSCLKKWYFPMFSRMLLLVFVAGNNARHARHLPPPTNLFKS